MSLFEIDGGHLREVSNTTFAKEKVLERRDLQEMLKNNIEVILPDTMVLSTEYGEWAESHRRIDLLCLGKDARLLVVELKREDGGHMELQAIRYAAMVSGMTFNDAVGCLSRFKKFDEPMSEKAILDFLEWEEPQDDFAKEIEIVLVSSEFSKEITSTVLWLSDYDLKFSCIRLQPYRHEGKVLVDVEKIFPLPEAEDYQIKIRRKEREERNMRRQNRDMTRFDLAIGSETFENLPKRELILRVAKTAFLKGHKPLEIIRNGRFWISVNGRLDSAAFIEEAVAGRLAGSSTSEVGRFFTGDEQLFQMSDMTFALTKMWGDNTITTVKDIIKQYGLNDIKFAPMGGELGN